MRSVVIILILNVLLISMSFLQQIQIRQNLTEGSSYSTIYVLPYIAPSCNYRSRYFVFKISSCEHYKDTPALELIGSVGRDSDDGIFTNKRLMITDIQPYHPSLYSLNDWIVLIQILLSQVRTGLYQLVLDSTYPLQAGFIIAILFGVTDWLSTVIKPYFANTGTLHILAASGSHVSLVLGVVSGVVQRVSFRPRGLILIFALVLYQFLLGDSPSITRAATMSTLMLCAKFIFFRQASTSYCLFLASSILLIWRPEWLYAIGFLLSVAATAGIVIIYPRITRLFRIIDVDKNQTDSLFLQEKITTISSYMLKQLAVGFSAQLTILPLLLFYFHSTPLLGFVATAAVTWFVPYLMKSLMLAIGLQVIMYQFPLTLYLQQINSSVLMWVPSKFFLSLMAALSNLSWLEWGIPYD